MHNKQVLRAALALLFLGNAEAFWRMQCAIIQRGRIDTLVNPGALAAHSHSIIGGSSKFKVTRESTAILTGYRLWH